MQKSLVFLPLALLVLAGCNSNNAPVSDTDIPNAAPLDLGTELQSTEMPSSMNQPGRSTAVYTPAPPSPTPSYTPPPSYNNQPSYTPAQTTPTQPVYSQPTAAPSYSEQTAANVGNCQVVRDASNAPIYAQIQKGCYTDATYRVNKGDTIFLIAYLTGNSVENLARLNNLVQPYPLKLGQTLRVK